MSVQSTSLGWVCKNGHFNDRNFSATVCTYGWTGGMTFPCGAIRDPRGLYEGITPDTTMMTPETKGTWLSDREAEKSKRYRFDMKKGRFVCFRCAELFASKTNDHVEQDAKATGVLQPGSALEFFSTKEDLRWHIKTVHRGKPYADKDIRKMKRSTEKTEMDKLTREIRDATQRKKGD